MITIKNIVILALITAAGIVYSQQEINTEALNPEMNIELKNSADFVLLKGYAVNSSGKIIYKTTDGGITWLNQIVPSRKQLKPIIKEVKSSGSILKREAAKDRLIAGSSLKGSEKKNFMPHDDFVNTSGSLQTIEFTLQYPGFVSIKIYDEKGNTIDELARSSFGSGSHEVKWNQEKVKTVGYFYSVVTSEFSETKKLVQ